MNAATHTPNPESSSELDFPKANVSYHTNRLLHLEMIVLLTGLFGCYCWIAYRASQMVLETGSGSEQTEFELWTYGYGIGFSLTAVSVVAQSAVIFLLLWSIFQIRPLRKRITIASEALNMSCLLIAIVISLIVTTALVDNPDLVFDMLHSVVSLFSSDEVPTTASDGTPLA